MVEEKERALAELQKKAASLERRLQGNLSQDEHLQELLQEVRVWAMLAGTAGPCARWPLKVSKISLPCFNPPKKSSLEESLEESRAELLALRTNQADSVGSLEAQVIHGPRCPPPTPPG